MTNPLWPDRTVAQLTVIGQALGAQIVLTHHFQANTTLEGTFVSDSVAATSALGLATAWIAGQKTAYLACLASSYSMLTVKSQIVERPGTWRHRLTPDETPSTGTGTGNSASPTSNAQTAIVLRWRTARAGKSYRGRSYLGPIADGWMSSGLVAAGGITAAGAYGTAMLTAYGALTVPEPTWVLTVYSRPYNYGEYGYLQGRNPSRTFHYPPEYAGDATNITTRSVDSVLRVQRRRQIGVGS
jgi:hypothetical protein